LQQAHKRQRPRTGSPPGGPGPRLAGFAKYGVRSLAKPEASRGQAAAAVPAAAAASVAAAAAAAAARR
jgi:hypothetical protein